MCALVTGVQTCALPIFIRLSDNDNTVPETSAGINHPSVGVYTYNWTPAATAELGNYLVVWEGTDAQAETVTANELVEVTVTAALAGTWATPAEDRKSTRLNSSH